jgi:aspartyl-tRNA(Asn)/glutamyl-tRNA(Gln) amidotransferase subunit C
MKIGMEQILKVSELARLDLTEDEKNEFSKQLSDIVSYVDKIGEMNTENVIPADHIAGLKNVFRGSRPAEPISESDIKKMAPCFEGGHFIVPRIIEG